MAFISAIIAIRQRAAILLICLLEQDRTICETCHERGAGEISLKALLPAPKVMSITKKTLYLLTENATVGHAERKLKDTI